MTPTPVARKVSFEAFIYGYEDGKFHGDYSITREQFIAILYRLNSDMEMAYKAAPSFKDAAPERWSYDAIEWALSEEIIKPDANGNIRPGDALTRAEMAVMLVKCDDLTESTEDSFNDLDDHEDLDYILKAVNAGIFNGYPDGSFRPDSKTTRTEAVAALVRYLLGGEPAEEMLEDLEMRFTDVPKTHWAYEYVLLATHGYTGLV